MSWNVKQFGRFFTTDGRSGNVLQVESPLGRIVTIELTESGFQTFLKEFEAVQSGIEFPSSGITTAAPKAPLELVGSQIGLEDDVFGGDPP